jgi:ASC-1-like (ASCH) protein
MIHVAFLHKKYLDAIERGEKTIESRLSINRPPCWNIKDSDILLLKETSGEIRLSARIKAIHKFDNLQSEDITILAQLFADGCGVSLDDKYWLAKSKSRYAVFIELRSVSKISFAKDLTPRGFQSGWVILPEDKLFGV